jgi:hypothetical protein
MEAVGNGIKQYAPDAFVICIRGGFQNWRARRFATKNMHAL